MNMVSFSIVIPTYRRPDTLELCLEHIARLDYDLGRKTCVRSLARFTSRRQQFARIKRTEVMNVPSGVNNLDWTSQCYGLPIQFLQSLHYITPGQRILLQLAQSNGVDRACNEGAYKQWSDD